MAENDIYWFMLSILKDLVHARFDWVWLLSIHDLETHNFEHINWLTADGVFILKQMTKYIFRFLSDWYLHYEKKNLSTGQVWFYTSGTIGS